MSDPISVVVVDDHPVFRLGMTALLGSLDGVEVVVSARSLLCPPSWVGVVTLGGSALVTAPDDRSAALLRRTFAGLPAPTLTDPD